MSAQGAGATDVAEETEPTKATTEQPSKERQSLEDVLLNVAREEGHSIGKEEARVVTPNTEEEDTETETETETATEETPPETTGETSTTGEEEEETPPAEKRDDEWPPSAKERVAEESAKRKKAVKRAETAEGKVEELTAQLNQAVAPRPSEKNPFADVYTDADLQKIEASYERMLEFAEKNRNGATDVVVGRDKDGKEILQDFTAEEVADIHYKADRALRRDIPRRRDYLTDRARNDAVALEAYPDFKDETSPLMQQAAGIVRANPELEAILGPDILMVIGDYLTGLNTRLKKNGTGTRAASETTRKILETREQRKAPTPTKTRTFTERVVRGSDLAKAEERLKKEKSHEAAEDYVAAVLSHGKSGPTKTVEHAKG